MSWEELAEVRQNRLLQVLRVHPVPTIDLDCLDCGAKPGERCVYIWPDDATEWQRNQSMSATMVKYRARIGKTIPDRFHNDRVLGGMSPLSEMVRSHEAWAPVIELFQEMEK